VLALPTLTHIHMSAIPVLAGEGTILVDMRAHKTVYDGCLIARSHGATLIPYQHDDADHLQALLREAHPAPILICTDGVNSMTGDMPPLVTFARLAREHDALLYVDDAHGFGVIGERSSHEPSPYGLRGNGIVRYAGETYESIVFTAGLSKAYSSLMAFLAVPSSLKDVLKVQAAPYLWSGPSPTASLATVLLGLKVNADRGDRLRAAIYRRTARLLDALRELDVFTPNHTGFPIVQIPLADPYDLDDVGRFLFDAGIYVTLAPYPGVPKDQVGFRIQVTAANTDEQIEQLIRVIGEVALRYRLRPAACGDALETPKAKLLLIAPSPEDEGSEPLGSDPSTT
jgi:8-amino-7-oxononanoate synthase